MNSTVIVTLCDPISMYPTVFLGFCYFFSSIKDITDDISQKSRIFEKVDGRANGEMTLRLPRLNINV